MVGAVNAVMAALIYVQVVVMEGLRRGSRVLVANNNFIYHRNTPR